MAIDMRSWKHTWENDDALVQRRLACMKGGTGTALARTYFRKYMELKSQNNPEFSPIEFSKKMAKLKTAAQAVLDSSDIMTPELLELAEVLDAS